MFFQNSKEITSISTDAQANKIVINETAIDTSRVKLVSNWSTPKSIASVVSHNVYNAECDNVSTKIDGVVVKLPIKESIVLETIQGNLQSISVYREDV